MADTPGIVVFGGEPPVIELPQGRDREIIENAIVRLLKHEPFYANIVIQFQKRAVKNIPNLRWAGVGFNGSEIMLYINVDNFAKECHDVQEGILKHEIMHVINMHFSRMGNRNRDKWNIATDLAINQIVGKDNLPNGVFFTDSTMFKPPLPLNKAAEEYYKMLPKMPECPTCGGSGQVDKSGQPCPTCQRQGHNFWDQFENSPSNFVKSVIKKTIQESIKQVGRGNIPGECAEAVKDLLESKINWKGIIRRFGRSIRTNNLKATWKRLNKRFGTKMMGYRRIWKSFLVIGVDTSASISTLDLKHFGGEILGIKRTGADVLVIEFDTQVNNFYYLKKKFNTEFTFHGRGGTRLEAIPEWIKKELKNRQPNGLIMLTDMDGGPMSQPPFPTLFCLAPHANESLVKHNAPWSNLHIVIESAEDSDDF